MKVVMIGSALHVKGGIPAVEELMLRYCPRGLRLQHLPSHSDRSMAQCVCTFVNAAIKLAWLLVTRQVDLVHIHFTIRGSSLRKTLLTALVLPFGVPVILHAHGGKFDAFFNNLPRWMQAMLRCVMARCRLLITLSTSWKKFYTECFRMSDDRVTVLANPIAPPRSIPDRTERSEITFVFIGQIVRSKGAFDLIQAFSTLQPHLMERTKLILAGNGETMYARQLAQELGIEKRCSVSDWLEVEQRNELLRRADVFVLPSLHEGMPMALLEAMSWGLPAISTPVGGIPEVLSDNKNGLMVPPGNQAALTASIERLVGDAELRERLGKAARESVESLSISKYWESLLRLYSSVLPSSKCL